MGKAKYAYNRGSEKNLEVIWSGRNFANVVVMLNGEEVGRSDDANEVAAGKDITLPDGAVLNLKVVKDWIWGNKLHVSINGEAVAGSPGDDNAKLKQVSILVFFIAGINLILGGIAYLGKIDFLLNLGVGLYNIGFGVVFALLGFLAMKRSVVAMILAIIIFGADGLIGIVLGIAAGSNPTAGVVLKVFIFIVLLQGPKVIKRLKEKENLGGQMQ